MRRRVMLVLVLAALVVTAAGAFFYLHAAQPRQDVQELTLPEGHREFPVETVWVVVQGEEGLIEVPVPLDIPASWTGKYEVGAEGNVACWDYVANADKKQCIFSIAALTDAQWEAIQGEPHGEALFSYGGFVWVYSPALDNPYRGSQADEFQLMVGEAYQIAGSLGTFLVPADPAQAARQVLLAYFGALRAGRYAEADRLYGGSYEVLVDMNPEIDPQNHAALLEAACTVNGFVCQLEPEPAVQVYRDRADLYYFSVEFRNPDGSAFELGCAEPDSGCVTRAQFDYAVGKLFEQYRVLDLPVYVP